MLAKKKAVKKNARKVAKKKTAKKAVIKTAKGYAKSAADLAVELEVSRQTVQTYLKLPGCPGRQRNGYPIAAWIKWAKALDMGKGRLDKERQGAKTQKEQAQAAYWEFRVARERGEYVPQSEMEKQWKARVGKAIALLRSKFESELPPLTEGLTPVEVQKLNRAAVDEVVLTLHRGGS